MPVKIIFCYAHEDEPLLNKLKSHLKPLQRQGLIDVWHDRDTSAGTEWEEEISKHLNEADIILLLVSPDFMDSDYCYSKEMKRALERHERREAGVIPVILRPVYWQGVLGNLLALPTDAKPVISASWHNIDEAFFDVAEGLRKVVQELLQTKTVDEKTSFDETYSYMPIPTGFQDLDRMMGGGLQRSDLIIVGAPSSTGKTCFALNIALNAAIKHARSIGIFSLEMSKDRLSKRLLSMDAGINQQSLQSGLLEDHKKDRIVISMDTLLEAKIWIDDTAKLTITELLQRAHTIVIERSVELIIVDYIDLIQSGVMQKRYDNKEQVDYEMSRYLKVLARELNVPVLALTQKPRKIGSRRPISPQEDAIDKDADIVIYLYRDDLYDEFSERKNLIDVIVSKNRNGPTGETSLYFYHDTLRFRDLVMYPQEDASNSVG